ncbi:MAG: hypothetical protein ACOX5G_02815 [Kiritimatiellia bacterium]|jgi:Na+/H+-dicarboxylate symporter
MHIVALFFVAAIAWGITARARGKTAGAVVGFAVLGGVLAVFLGFGLYRWLSSGSMIDFERDMLRKMPDIQYIITFEVLPALVGSVIVGVLAIPRRKNKTEPPSNSR